MKVILNQDYSKLGVRGEIVEVKSGFYRNFLAPRNLAKVLTKNDKKLVEMRSENMKMRKEQMIQNAKEVIEKLNGQVIEITAKANEKGVLFASISIDELVGKINELYPVEFSSDFLTYQPVKNIGEYPTSINIAGEKGEFILKVSNE